MFRGKGNDSCISGRLCKVHYCPKCRKKDKAEQKELMGDYKCTHHEPFINPANGGKPVECVDEDGLLGKKGKVYYECYICNTYYDPKTKKAVKDYCSFRHFSTSMK